MLDLAWPVHRARHAVLAGDPFPALEPEEVSLCLWRRDEQVVHRELPGAESTALALAATGLSFGALCERIAAEVGDEEAPARAAAWLGSWIDARLVARLAART